MIAGFSAEVIALIGPEHTRRVVRFYYGFDLLHEWDVDPAAERTWKLMTTGTVRRCDAAITEFVVGKLTEVLAE